MSEASTHYTRRKCPECGLVNAGADEQCRRCGGLLSDADAFVPQAVDAEPVVRPHKRTLLKRIGWIVSATLVVMIIWYVSLLLTSERLPPDQHLKVDVAIGLIEQSGFTKEGFILRHATIFRSTDNWWNNYIGHRDAYAATNFPFEVLTLYPEFFAHSADDTERAVILLHEAQHLYGAGEEGALEHVWRNKQRLGWTEDKYGQTRVWINTKELTMTLVPKLFKCGPEGNADCVP